MKKPISIATHGIIDYTYATVVPLIPHLTGFDDQKIPAIICRALGAGALTYTVLTKANWGLIKLIPAKTHLMIDITVSLLALASPWLFAFNKKNVARNALMGIGAAGLIASLLTDPGSKGGS